MSLKIKEIKMDLSDVPFQNPSSIQDGLNGKILEKAMIEKGFKLDSTGTVDLPQGGIEVKTRRASTKSNHTVGTMTCDAIINTSWEDTPFKKKLQKQYRVTIREGNPFTGKVVATGETVDLSHPEIQHYFEQAYEECRRQLTKQIVTTGEIIPGQTITGGQFGVLENKPGKTRKGKSFAWRIPDSGMKKVLGISNSIKRGFTFD
jgi:hypothetical protein